MDIDFLHIYSGYFTSTSMFILYTSLHNAGPHFRAIFSSCVQELNMNDFEAPKRRKMGACMPILSSSSCFAENHPRTTFYE